MDYIKAHINDYPRKEVAKAAGVTLHTLSLLSRLEIIGPEKARI